MQSFDMKFMFSKKATKIDKIFSIKLTLCSKCQIDGEDFFNFCGLHRKQELYNGYLLTFNYPLPQRFFEWMFVLCPINGFKS